ncbi:hypothetical protein [Tianweitania sediminis]|uniref:Uncharacterized protein n=1 Tax=Tianweitania sediminis TaxID=1502156 RepID=A0A8J7R414_9HYPH|nr:hypothetical protein [Tianweitania sediminis]MBP0440653.1 hypothetical protein [Tianweitania sediminis]
MLTARTFKVWFWSLRPVPQSVVFGILAGGTCTIISKFLSAIIGLIIS